MLASYRIVFGMYFGAVDRMQSYGKCYDYIIEYTICMSTNVYPPSISSIRTEIYSAALTRKRERQKFFRMWTEPIECYPIRLSERV